MKRLYPWVTRDYDYEHAAVRLRFFRVTEWSGELHGRENQAFAWQRIDDLTVGPLLPANGPILRALALPTLYGISNAAQVGIDAFLDQLELALKRGLRLVQIREKALGPPELTALAKHAVTMRRAGPRECRRVHSVERWRRRCSSHRSSSSRELVPS